MMDTSTLVARRHMLCCAIATISYAWPGAGWFVAGLCDMEACGQVCRCNASYVAQPAGGLGRRMLPLQQQMAPQHVRCHVVHCAAACCKQCSLRWQCAMQYNTLKLACVAGIVNGAWQGVLEHSERGSRAGRGWVAELGLLLGRLIGCIFRTLQVPHYWWVLCAGNLKATYT
jgi:hypothetical protein